MLSGCSGRLAGSWGGGFIPPHYYCLLYAPSSFYFWFINLSIPLIGDYSRSLSDSFVPVPPPPTNRRSYCTRFGEQIQYIVVICSLVVVSTAVSFICGAEYTVSTSTLPSLIHPVIAKRKMQSSHLLNVLA